MDIRKADSKGRLTGFNPGVHYQVVNRGDVFKAHRLTYLDEVMDVSNMPGAASEASQEYLRRFGIDPLDMSREGCLEEGYSYMVRDENGKRIRDYGAYRIERRPWPEGFDWNTFVGLVVEGEGGDVVD